MRTSMNTDESQPVSARALAKSSQGNLDPERELLLALGKVRADTRALYLKTKSFRSHMCGPHFREYHPLLEAQAEQLFAMGDAITGRMRKMNSSHGRCIDHGGLPGLSNNDNVEFVSPEDVLAQLRVDNQILVGSLRSTQMLCQSCDDIDTENLIGVWIHEARGRAWFLFEVTRSD
jgi:starvation-inducible DNA-binding protein